MLRGLRHMFGDPIAVVSRFDLHPLINSFISLRSPLKPSMSWIPWGHGIWALAGRGFLGVKEFEHLMVLYSLGSRNPHLHLDLWNFLLFSLIRHDSRVLFFHHSILSSFLSFSHQFLFFVLASLGHSFAQTWDISLISTRSWISCTQGKILVLHPKVVDSLTSSKNVDLPA